MVPMVYIQSTSKTSVSQNHRLSTFVLMAHWKTKCINCFMLQNKRKIPTNKAKNQLSQARDELYKQGLEKKKLQQKEKSYKLSERYDYALLNIQKIIDRDSYPILSSECANEQQVVVCGYAQETLDTYTQYMQSNKITLDQGVGLYDIDTRKGQSGSIVYLKRNRKMFGIHKGLDPKKKINCFTLTSSEMITELQAWQIELNVNNVVFKAQGRNLTNITRQNTELKKKLQRQDQQLRKYRQNKTEEEKQRQLLKMLQQLPKFFQSLKELNQILKRKQSETK